VRDGAVVADLRGPEVTEHNIVHAFFESAPEPVPAGSTS
jgi:hypothetical protein